MARKNDPAGKEILIDLVVGLVLGVITVIALRHLGEATADLAGILGVVAGLMSGIYSFCLRSFRVIRESSEDTEQAHRDLLRAIQEYSHSRKFGLLRLIDNLALYIKAEKVPKVWRELLWDVQHEYLATNYQPNIYKTAWADAALGVQAAKIKEGLRVRKVFIVFDDGELKDSLDQYLEQAKVGIVARYICQDDIATRIKNDSMFAGRLAGLKGQHDFGVFDERFVLKWNLSANDRQVESGEVLTDGVGVVEYRAAFEALFEAARPLPSGLEILPLKHKHVEEIQGWPEYEAPYEDFNYALKPGVGWLDKQGKTPGALVLGGFQDNLLIAFSILVPDGHGKAEFYVAVRATDIGKGVGREMTRRTMCYGFVHCDFDRIWLKVRKNHPTGKKLYEKIGFVKIGSETETIVDKPVEFYKMELTYPLYKKAEERSFR